ncbi:MAG: gliding motility-associated ABC transporter substrate-binding protein GldG [Bacteroidales bacterium]|nr:gliding motility-associated ABC transporter substrate-binding protein GldG [Bacteroidales bacterium]
MVKKGKEIAVRSKELRGQQWLGFVLIIVSIFAVNIIGGYVFTRFDLTAEKRYTLAPETKRLLRSLDDIVFFRVYLEGEFPAGFKRLRREAKEMLDEFRAYSKYVEYEFIDPMEGATPQEVKETVNQLIEQGLQPTDLQIQTTAGREQKVIFPGAMVMYRDQELPLDLLEEQLNTPPEIVLNNSIQNLEFKMADMIRKITLKQKPSIAFITGHGELSETGVHDITQTLSQNYRVERIEIGGKVYALIHRSEPDEDGNIRIIPEYEAIIIAKPQSAFDEKDKFIIDQYIMHGGKVLWLIDPVIASMDSLQDNESTVAIDLDLKLDDMFFKYGLRLNKNLVLDLNSAQIPLRTGQLGTQAQIEFFRWYYFPLLNQASNHPMVRNINAIKADFVSSIDTTFADGIKKIPLLRSSPYSRVSATPALISLAMLRDQPDERMYNRGPQITAYLLEGEFESLYKNRMPPEIADSKEMGFREQSFPTSMIVVADGDMILNQFHVPKGYPLPLGFDQYTRRTYGNKDFLLNAISYLADESGLISIRSRELKLRLLDESKVRKERLTWQLINIVIPVLLVFLIGLLLTVRRKRKFAVHKKINRNT